MVSMDYKLDPPEPAALICQTCGESWEDCDCCEDDRNLIDAEEYHRGRAEDAAYDAYMDR